MSMPIPFYMTIVLAAKILDATKLWLQDRHLSQCHKHAFLDKPSMNRKSERIPHPAAAGLRG
jgi:hypothetical protein